MIFDMSRKPGFLGIGGPRCGTSWLYQNLKCHPEIFMRKKEIHYFDKKINIHNIYWYSSLFECDKKLISGEITPAYCNLSIRLIRCVHLLFPHVKLILLMRNPIERFWSSITYFHVIRKHKNYEDIPKSIWYEYFGSEYHLQFGDYIYLINKWLSIFSEKQLYLNFYDNIINHPKELLIDIFEYLNISVDVEWDKFSYKNVVGRGPKIPMPDEYRKILEEIYCDKIDKMYKRFGNIVEHWRCKGILQ